MDCHAFCTANSYKIRAIYDSLKSRYNSTLYRDALHIEIPFEGQTTNLFCFSYGSLVSWGLPKDQAINFLHEIRFYEVQHFDEIETDEFTYIYGDIQKVADDEITLPNKDILTKLAISHAIAQSVKLGSFETRIQKTFDHTKYIPEDLARFGRISLSKREIRRKMGELFIERSSINLHAGVLDTPEFFWEYPEMESIYKMIAIYLDLETRVIVLNQRLDVMHELFEMLGTELNHQHSSRLEWTIIWLIIIEVILTLLRDVFQMI